MILPYISTLPDNQKEFNLLICGIHTRRADFAQLNCGERIRTANLSLMKTLLCRLSYTAA